MADTEILMTAIRGESSRIDAAMHTDLDALAETADGLLTEVLRYSLFNGGKRIRPLLVVLAARLCGRSDPAVYDLARAFEYLHAATLMHDDVIDNAETRRGRPSVYKKFGLVAAILAGDFLHARSMAIVGELAGTEALSVFSEATGRIVDGEFLQIRNAADHNLREDDYQRAILGKTGLLIAAACEVGAIWAGRGREERLALRSYGIHLGCAFQIIDDLLDYQGDTGKTGKAVGNDLAEGKMTLPLILAVQQADQEDRQRLQDILADEVHRRHTFAEVSSLIEKYNGFSLSKRKAEEAATAALTQLEIFPCKAGGQEKQILQGLVKYVLDREK
jgi:octaprenyl-diphosphate synthase